jgi:hypothetical protein
MPFILPEPRSALTYWSIKLQRARHNLRLEPPPHRPCTRTIVLDNNMIIPVTLTTVRRGLRGPRLTPGSSRPRRPQTTPRHDVIF